MARSAAGKTIPGETEGAAAKSTETAVARDERAWDAQFAASQDVLEDLSDEITADPDRLTDTRRAKKSALAGPLSSISFP